MDWFARLLRGSERRTLQNPAQPLTSATVAALFAGPKTATGRGLSVETAMRQWTVNACMRRIASDVATLPLFVYRKVGSNAERATDHPVYKLLHSRPNPQLTPFKLKQMLVTHILAWGFALCEIEFDGAGRRRALWPIQPSYVTRRFDAAGQLEFEVQVPGQPVRVLPAWRVWYVNGASLDAYGGDSLILSARETIGLALAMEEYGGRFFANDGRPGGVLQHPGKLTPQSALRLAQNWKDAHSGLDNAHSVAVLEEGTTFTPIGFDPESSQFSESYMNVVMALCGYFSVPPHLAGLVDRSTSWGNGIMEQNKMYIANTLMPYLTQIQQTANQDLLTESECDGGLYVEFLTEERLKADMTARLNAYSTAIAAMVMVPNEARARENLPPLPGGDMPVRPANMLPVGPDGLSKAPEPAPNADRGVDVGVTDGQAAPVN